MAKKKKGKRIIQKLKNRYRLIIYNDSTYHATWSVKLTPLKVVSFFGLGSFFLICFILWLIIFTPIREMLPGYPTKEERNLVFRNMILLDSLNEQIQIRDNYLNNIKALILGDLPQEDINQNDTNREIGHANIRTYNHDSIFKQDLLVEQLDISSNVENRQISNIAGIHFFSPLKGIVSQKFDKSSDHLAVDVVGLINSRISSVLDGTVIFSGWTIETGHVIYLQHANDMISVYKHNAVLLKKTGDNVKAGEAIAIMGNSGELTTGPHLHFELWHKGIPLDPEKHIEF